jgi:predicted dehydrogenase
MLARFESGGSANGIYSFESPHTRVGFVEITGTEATLSVPDPNFFDGPLTICRAGDTEWTALPTTGPADGRGIGVLDMARSIRAQEPHRASGELAYHVLDTMVSVSESIDAIAFSEVASSARVPAPLPEGWSPGEATLEGVPA